ncbi:MAG: HNH endonuclease signature motif containing protein [Telluria sp.]|nr:HNH endonuclease signature motif containing protein [Telluria sp.]
MKEVSPGDIIFSFADTKIPAIGVALSHAYEAPKPLEFGHVGAYWDVIGWRVDVHFTVLTQQIRPVEYIDRLRGFLPPKYSPLQPSGDGLQSVYLTTVNDRLAAQLVDLIGTEARAVIQNWGVADTNQNLVLVGQAEWEEHQVDQVKSMAGMSETEKRAIVLARRGQGLFRTRVALIEKKCRLTGTANLEYLRASHTKPWRDATNDERLDGENGFLLTPDADFLFDRGFISFQNSGQVLVSPVADLISIGMMGITQSMLQNVGAFSAGQRQYLEFHRENIFLEAKVTVV